jgi:formylglycine-generating enzyme required for sulfatase activity
VTEIFISYKSERRRAAEHLAAVLDRHGYSVWFDYQLIKGRDFGLQIDRKVREAKALVVLWCTRSVGSRWVAEEVDLAHELGILVPVKIEPCTLSIGFRRQDYIDLSDWDGSPRSHRLDPLLDALEEKIGRPPAPDFKALREYETTWRRFGALPLKSFAFDQASEAGEVDRGLPDRPTPSGSIGPSTSNDGDVANGDRRLLLTVAAQEWPAARDSRDARRLRVFEAHFTGTYYAELARQLREEIETAEGQQREAEARERAEVARRKAEGQIQLRSGVAPNEETRWLRPGAGKTEWFRDFAAAPEMVIVPAGTFLMGSRDEGDEDERPQHKVTIACPFAVGRFAITFDEWDAALRHGGVKHNPGDEGWGRGRRPVINVSWEDATTYVGWLSRETGKSYRLLSEAEWEYCCRAGTATPFWWGSSISASQANYDGNYTYGGGSKGEYRERTVPVDSFAANPFGLYQVHGNVWEWVEDCWHKDYSGNPPSDGSVWPGGDPSSRVLRGGSWVGIPQYLRSAIRDRGPPGVRNSGIGFRVARTLSPLSLNPFTS